MSVEGTDLKIQNKGKIFSLIAVSLYLLISGIVTYPSVLRMDKSVLGGEFSDIHTHLWDLWRTGPAALGGGGSFLSAGGINFPHGGYLFPASALNSLVAFPLQYFLNIAVTINVIILFNLALSAYGAFCLANYLIRDRTAAFISGLIYGFSPYLLSFGVASGGIEIVSAAWIPFCVLFLIRSLREKGSWLPAVTALFFLLTVTACVYYSFVLSFFILFLLVYFFVFKGWRRELFLVSDEEDNGFSFSATVVVRRLCVAFILILILISPVYLFLFKSLSSPDSVIPAEMFRQRIKGSFLSDFSPDVPAHSGGIVFLTDYLLPGKDHLMVSHEVTDFFMSNYIGLSVLSLSVIALFLCRRRRPVRFWIFTAIMSAFLSIGPYFAVSRDVFLPGPNSPLYSLIFAIVPQFKAAVLSNRFVLAVMLCSSVLAGVGLSSITRRRRHSVKLLCAVLAGGIVILETVFVSPVRFPLPSADLSVPDFYKRLAEENGRFGILELPFFIKGSNLMPREHFSFQTFHGKAITDTVAGFLPRYVSVNPCTRRLVLIERPDYEFNFYSSDSLLGSLEEGVKQLKADNFRYIVVNRKYYDPEVLVKVERVLSRLVDKREVYPDGMEVFSLQ